MSGASTRGVGPVFQEGLSAPVVVVIGAPTRVRIVGSFHVGGRASVGVVVAPAFRLGAGSGVVIVLPRPIIARVRVIGLSPGSTYAGIRVVARRLPGPGSRIRIVAFPGVVVLSLDGCDP